MNQNLPKTKVVIERAKAKFVAQTCVVCNGFGTLRHGTLKCHGCAGKGYILIPTTDEEVKND